MCALIPSYLLVLVEGEVSLREFPTRPRKTIKQVLVPRALDDKVMHACSNDPETQTMS